MKPVIKPLQCSFLPLPELVSQVSVGGCAYPRNLENPTLDFWKSLYGKLVEELTGARVFVFRCLPPPALLYLLSLHNNIFSSNTSGEICENILSCLQSTNWLKYWTQQHDGTTICILVYFLVVG